MVVEYLGPTQALLLSVALYAASVLIVRHATGGFSFISPVHLYLFFYTMYVYVWAVALFTIGEPLSVGSVSLPQPDGRFLAASTLGVSAFALGAFGVAAATGFRPRDALAVRRQTPLADDLSGTAPTGAIVVLLLVGGGLAAVFFAVKGFPIAAYIQAIGDPRFFKVMSEAREESMTGMGYLLQGVTTVLPAGVLLLFARARLRKTLLAGVLAWTAIGVLVALMFSLTSRGHFAMFIILLFVTGQAISAHVKWSRIGLWVGAFFALFGFSSLVKFGMLENWEGISSTTISAWTILLDRLSMGVKQMHALMLLFPREYPFLFGQSMLWDALALLPGADVGFNRWAFELMYPAVAVPANITPTSIGEWYANFGMLGIAAMSAILGGGLQWCHQQLVRGGQPTSRVVLLVFISSYLAKTALNGLGAMVEPIISGLCAFGVFYVARYFLKFARTMLARELAVEPVHAGAEHARGRAS